MQKPKLTPEALYAYARKFAEEAEAKHPHRQYPTFREAAKHFRVTIAAISDAIDDWSGEEYMAAAIGYKTGTGYGLYERKGDHQVEAYP